MSTQKRTKTIHVRVSEQEWDYIHRIAKEAATPVSKLLRERTLYPRTVVRSVPQPYPEQGTLTLGSRVYTVALAKDIIEDKVANHE